ncbi:MAG: homoserine dehydrogenase [Desulfovibrio sp.]|jgi:homoserine dehydrogenase|nr:homoserine dehydrogenase [Desulfovibrio sp.]
MADGHNPPLTLGIAGFGTVGSGLLRILRENRAEITARTGREVRVKSVLVRDLSKARACPPPDGARLTDNPDDLLKDPETDVFVELIGGIETAGELVGKALRAGKHVVTANKALLAERGNEIFALAAEKKLHLGYEASVCGGIPIIRTLREALAGDRLDSIVGILNGTSNFILSEMSDKGMDFAAALKEAQTRGYAEADPVLDIDGRDAAQKLYLLIRLAWGAEYPYAAIPVSGITGVSPADIRYAREFGCRVKLICYARLHGDDPRSGGIEAGVCPALVNERFLLARVEGAYNAVRVEGNAAGSVFLHGKGAGDLPTGSSVAADILDIAKNVPPCNTGFAGPHPTAPARVIGPRESFSPHYLRLNVADRPGVLRDVAAVLADHAISLAQVIQKDDAAETAPPPAGKAGPYTASLILMTHKASDDAVHKAVTALAALPFVRESPVRFRVLTGKSGELPRLRAGS